MAFKDPEEKRAWLRRWRAANPERVAEHRQRWIDKHPGEALKQSRRTREKNRAKINARRRARYAANRAAGVPCSQCNRAVPKEHLTAADVADIRDMF